MKKMVYQQPTTTIVVVEHTQMLAASGPAVDKNFQRQGYGNASSNTWGSYTPAVKANGNYVDWDKE